MKFAMFGLSLVDIRSLLGEYIILTLFFYLRLLESKN